MLIGSPKLHREAILGVRMSILATQWSSFGLGPFPKLTFEGCLERKQHYQVVRVGVGSVWGALGMPQANHLGPSHRHPR